MQRGASSWRRFDRLALPGAALALAASFLDAGLPLSRARFEHVVVLDVTQSMNVQDVQLAGQSVSRLDFAKQALREALPELPCGSKLGWGVFTEYRSLLLFAPVEVCANRSELRATLALIDGRMAWAGASEVAKGLHSGIGIVKQLPGGPSLVFVTDGHEAPPLNPLRRPAFDDKPGEVRGVIVGVGALALSPIPKKDGLGRPLGFWRADEVVQTDPRALGRGGSVGGERMVDEGAASDAGARLGATPGSEHLSSLHEGYLRLLAGELGLGFHALESAQGLSSALTDPLFSRPVRVRTELRLGLAGLALGLLLARHALPAWRARRGRKGVR